MSLSKKHYEEFAFILGFSATADEVIERFCKYLKKDNPNFNTQKFLNRIDECAEKRYQEWLKRDNLDTEIEELPFGFFLNHIQQNRESS